MDLQTVLGFALVASLLVMSPGPNGVLIAKTVPTSGKGAGFANVAGFVAAFYAHGTLAILGISLILVQSAQAFFVIKMLGAIYLSWIGIKALRDAWRGIGATRDIAPARNERTLLKAFGEGFLTNALNPKVSMFYLAAFPQFMTIGANSTQSAFFLVFVHSVINLVWFSAMVVLFEQLSKAARGEAFQRWLKAITGLVFVGFGLKLATLRAS